MKTKSTNSINFKGRLGRIFTWVFVFALIVPLTTFSQWQGNPVSTAGNNQINPMMTTDGSGGTMDDKRCARMLNCI